MSTGREHMRVFSSLNTRCCYDSAGSSIRQVTGRRCSDPRDDTESYGLGVDLVRDVQLRPREAFPLVVWSAC